MPISGFQHGELVGLIAGTIAGSLYSSVFVLIGLANGIYQILVGIKETPNALRAIHRGMVWDPLTEHWKVYFLDEEHRELSAYTSYNTSNRPVKDMSYYNLLGIPANAHPKEIKKAYYHKARSIHPDKNPGPEAAEKFLQLHAAYLTLSDDEKRVAYDTWGPALTDLGQSTRIPQFDPYVFYAILLSSRLVEPYIGELTIASFTDRVLQLERSGAETVDDLSKLFWSESNRKVRKRHVEIAMFLKEKVTDYVRGLESEETFRARCRSEATAIAGSPFGTEYLTAIGSALVLEGCNFLAFRQGLVGWFRGLAFMFQRKILRIKNFFQIVREVFDLLRHAHANANLQSPIEQIEVLWPKFMDVVWAYNFQDIDGTLHGACKKLFADASENSWYKRLERAEAIQIMGEEFVAVAAGASAAGERVDAGDPVARLEVAFHFAQMKVR